ncbi:hypothetical protein SDRG_01315 [Saprolegnia diclina VS20]|uniref:Sugar phosphate transporter domain-containing protein n=1 Tax=Saprolegnia diclina (strain VS20) TaxID=1156394 RepID=T0R306_SAPDV|nr:hypothetical protein SDRG_01315 [Saprolegnia diclina VS20]EQC41341.1 hypothetical protein SDRG_01315 [Saprolegnia diclina VS20]|eukprot:XP_008605055.1 hypothetical protein SDRG_01315 [Saprolegnia diclina VS20]
MKSSSGYGLLCVQAVFLFTGVFSTCAAQFIFYQGAGAQKAMLLPLCNYLGMMLVGVIPTPPSEAPATEALGKKHDDDVTTLDEPIDAPKSREAAELTRRQPTDVHLPDVVAMVEKPTKGGHRGYLNGALPLVHAMLLLNVFLDFAGCIFANIGLSMAGSGVYQVVYSSVVCWSALLSKAFLGKHVGRNEWLGIATVTFGLAFSALGQSNGGRNAGVVLMGCVNTLIAAGFYGGNYVAGEYMLKLPERPEPKVLCLRMGIICVSMISVYQMFFVLPQWNHMITKPVMDANGNPVHILAALFWYTMSQLAHGLTYFMMLGSCGAVTTGIMQSLRAVCVFALSSLLYCSHQESQCFDAKRGVATCVVVLGVLFYSYAKNQSASVLKPLQDKLPMPTLLVKNHVV